ncbi:L domain-like protein [Anaeromyces robustus]|uniref:L domain-like protein n=1 Tax=Anaeromyces robustus TaxID=1754192 RepID=A0A1Y1WC79_9FUNG|nr:L domain-like protein [Anaeromyces robustus]|eukprot:ORX71042.1 L domain-like protein [Anaeromyces robustus]
MFLLLLYIFIYSISLVLCNINKECIALKNFFDNNKSNLCIQNNCSFCNNEDINKIELEDEHIKSIYIYYNFNQMNYDNFPLFPELLYIILSGDEQGNPSISVLSSRFFELPKIEYLDISYSGIQTIQNNIKQDTVLKRLRLSNNEIKEFPELLIPLNLKDIYLDNNQITSLSPNFLNMPSIEILDFSNNQITNELYIPITLQKMTASNNNLSSIPIIDNTKYKLTDLDISYNFFNDQIFNNITAFDNLYLFSISGNKQITAIPSSIKKLKSLKMLYMSDMNIKEISNEIFKLSLDRLEINNNPNLQMKIINFNTRINECYFENTTILCYQPGTCKNIDENNIYNECTKEEIEEIKNSLEKDNEEISEKLNDDVKVVGGPINNNNNNENSKIIYIGIIIIIFLLLITIIAICYFKQYNNNNKEDKRINNIINERIKQHERILYERFNQERNNNTQNDNNYYSDNLEINTNQNFLNYSPNNSETYKRKSNNDRKFIINSPSIPYGYPILSPQNSFEELPSYAEFNENVIPTVDIKESDYLIHNMENNH